MYVMHGYCMTLIYFSYHVDLKHQSKFVVHSGQYLRAVDPGTRAIS